MSFGVIEALRASRPRETLELVHRLDRDTSGCLLVARDRATLTSLHALIRDGGMHKTYLALVAGSWQLGTKRIDAPLATDSREHGERHVRVAAGRQGLGQRVQAGAVLRAAGDADGSRTYRPAAPTRSASMPPTRAIRCWATTNTAIASAMPSSRPSG